MATLALNDALALALARVKVPHRRPAALSRAQARTAHRTGVPVRRDSMEAGSFEEHFFAVPAKGETDRLLRAARRMLDAGRQLRSEARRGERVLTPAEQAITTLTAGSVRVFEEILTLARLNKGRVFPSYDYLARATSLGRATVARALRILESVGFLLRQRRFKRVGSEGPGPRYAQTSNVYRAMLPGMVSRYLPRWMRPAPVPDDLLHMQEERAAQQQAMVESLAAREGIAATTDGALARILARIGAALDRQACESQDDTQPLTDSYIREGKAAAERTDQGNDRYRG